MTCNLTYQGSATTTGFKVQVTGPGSPTSVSLNFTQTATTSGTLAATLLPKARRHSRPLWEIAGNHCDHEHASRTHYVSGEWDDGGHGAGSGGSRRDGDGDRTAVIVCAAMRRFLPLLLLCGVAFGQGVTLTPRVTVTPKVTISPGSAGGGSAPTFVNACVQTSVFGTPATCNVGAVQVGDRIWYYVHGDNGAATFTPTDNCNTGGTSDTNVTELGPTVGGPGNAHTIQQGHFVVGAVTASCAVSIAYTGGGDDTLYVGVVRGATTVKLPAAINNQAGGTGTGANVITSQATTTTAAALCLGATVDVNLGGGTLTGGNHSGVDLQLA